MDDMELVARCVKRDKQAWDEFLTKYSRLIYNYIHSVLNTKGYSFSAQHASDIFQDIFLSLTKDNFKKLSTFKAKNGSSFASWLRQVTINFTIDYLRNFKPGLSLDNEVEDDFTLLDALRNDSLHIGKVLIKEEEVGQLEDCIERLNTDDKYFLELFFNQGLKPNTLKEHFRVSRSAIDMRKTRLIDKLRDCFKTKGFQLDF
ncbi:MAG: sigma-70 family RNA polymerase sigma factor [Candidatus Omnitrophota bacterium]|nr:sigma-70 family RNA polymerase sigma factor [Candidatus Omnitrophota bacterium]